MSSGPQIKIVFMGTPAFALPALNQLYNNSRFKILQVVTQPDRPAGRGLKLSEPAVKVRARELNLPVDQSVKLNRESQQKLTALKADVLIVVAYGKMIPNSLLSAFPMGSVNLHPSLLPKYRGASPIQSALLNGDLETGVTTMFMSEEMDAGDILLQEPVVITKDDNAGSLHDRLAENGARLLEKTLIGLAEKQITSRRQDPGEATFTKKITKAMGKISWSQIPSTIVNQIRAFTPWPGAYTYYRERLLRIARAKVFSENEPSVPGRILISSGGRLVIECGSGSIEVLEIQPEGRRHMLINEFQAGNQIEEGAILE